MRLASVTGKFDRGLFLSAAACCSETFGERRLRVATGYARLKGFCRRPGTCADGCTRAVLHSSSPPPAGALFRADDGRRARLARMRALQEPPATLPELIDAARLKEFGAPAYRALELLTASLPSMRWPACRPNGRSRPATCVAIAMRNRPGMGGRLFAAALVGALADAAEELRHRQRAAGRLSRPSRRRCGSAMANEPAAWSLADPSALLLGCQCQSLPARAERRGRRLLQLATPFRRQADRRASR